MPIETDISSQNSGTTPGITSGVVAFENDEPPKRNLIGIPYEELIALMTEELKQPRFRADQIWQWLYHQGVSDFSAMSNMSKAFRETLAEHFTIERSKTIRDLTSRDGTRKWLIEFEDGNKAETVYIPEEDRGTLCISSQVGCTLTCKFCHTGTQMLVRNLTAREIVDQIMIARDLLHDWPSSREDRKVTNIVLMGMGEPLFNYENVADAMTLLMDENGMALSKRRITLSTSGVIPEIKRCGEELGINLAISFHAVRDDLRSEIMPINNKYPIAELLEACRQYPAASNSRRITFEYVMLKDVNDTVEDAKTLVRLLKGIPAKINLIPFNPWPNSPYERSDDKQIRIFADIIQRAGYASPVRTPRGEDILAACGQLKSDSERIRKNKKPAPQNKESSE